MGYISLNKCSFSVVDLVLLLLLLLLLPLFILLLPLPRHRRGRSPLRTNQKQPPCSAEDFPRQQFLRRTPAHPGTRQPCTSPLSRPPCHCLLDILQRVRNATVLFLFITVRIRERSSAAKEQMEVLLIEQDVTRRRGETDAGRQGPWPDYKKINFVRWRRQRNQESH